VEVKAWRKNGKKKKEKKKRKKNGNFVRMTSLNTLCPISHD